MSNSNPGWGVYREDLILPHVAPIDDLLEHIIDDEATCWCKPTVDADVIIHHSIDLREDNE